MAQEKLGMAGDAGGDREATVTKAWGEGDRPQKRKKDTATVGHGDIQNSGKTLRHERGKRVVGEPRRSTCVHVRACVRLPLHRDNEPSVTAAGDLSKPRTVLVWLWLCWRSGQARVAEAGSREASQK